LGGHNGIQTNKYKELTGGCMEARNFLASVLPSTGYYLVASYGKKGGASNEEYVVSTIDEVVALAAELDAKGKDAYFALGSLAEKEVQSEPKLNKLTGETYTSTARRVKANIKYISVAFIEIDVEPSGIKNKKPCYTSKEEVLVDLQRFCKATKLPKPTLVDSGGGIHVYWRISGDIDPERQTRITSLLHALVAADMPLVADIGVMKDYTRVLRVPDTHNYKQDVPRPTKCLAIGKPVEFSDMIDLLTTRSQELGIATKKNTQGPLPDYMQGEVEHTIGLKFDEIPPLRFEKVISTCQQIKWANDNPNEVSEPLWLDCIRVLQKCVDHVAVIHDFSRGYKKYSPSETDKKIEHVISNYPTPVTCSRFKETNPEGCKGCQYAGKNSSPAWLAKDIALAEPPSVELVTNIGGTEIIQTQEIENPPPPYARTSLGTIVKLSGNADGSNDEFLVSNYDIYPTVRRSAFGIDEYTVWKVQVPNVGIVDVDVAASLLADVQGLYKHFLKYGVYFQPYAMKEVQQFLIAYLNHIQKKTKAEEVYKSYGWVGESKDKFVLNNKLFHSDGSVTRLSSKNIFPGVTTSGSLDKWVELMKFYEEPVYKKHRFAVLAGFATPMLAFTQFSGCVINLDGLPGNGKTTAIAAACSMYGKPSGKESLMISGGSKGFTIPGMFQLLGKLHNLPIGFDEITTLESQAAGELVHQVSQGVGKLRHDSFSGEQESWQLLVLSSSNGSLFQKISATKSDAAGEAVRIFEIYINANGHNKKEADQFVRSLNENYGIAGESVIQYLVSHKEQSIALVHKCIEKVDALTGDKSSDRFRTATVGLAWAIGLILKHELKLIDWDIKSTIEWAIGHISELREVVNDYVQTPVDVLSNFLDENRAGILIIQGVNGSKHIGAGTVEYMPLGRVIGRHEPDIGRLYIQRNAMQEYCNKAKVDHKYMEASLLKNGVITNTGARKSLGANTMLDKTVSRCWELNLLHPDLTEKTADLLDALTNQKELATVNV
jgi:hypothetical protein